MSEQLNMKDQITLAVSRVGLERSLTDIKVTDALLVGLQTDGAHHKQWALWKIAEIMGVTHYLSDIKDKGIAP